MMLIFPIKSFNVFPFLSGSSLYLKNSFSLSLFLFLQSP